MDAGPPAVAPSERESKEKVSIGSDSFCYVFLSATHLEALIVIMYLCAKTVI